MITKISNHINNYEDEQNKTLLPNFDNLDYIKAKSKLNDYKTELFSLQNI